MYNINNIDNNTEIGNKKDYISFCDFKFHAILRSSDNFDDQLLSVDRSIEWNLKSQQEMWSFLLPISVLLWLLLYKAPLSDLQLCLFLDANSLGRDLSSCFLFSPSHRDTTIADDYSKYFKNTNICKSEHNANGIHYRKGKAW